MGQKAAAGTGSPGRALARMARRCLGVPLALVLLLAGLTWSQPCRAEGPVRGEATFTAGGGSTLSTCVGAGILSRLSGRTEYAIVIKGEGCDFSNHSPLASARIEGANGRKISRCLMRRFNTSFISGRRGSATILRLPSALGPHSARP